MTPAARLSAAIAVLDRILGGDPAERALTNWGRASRFAGSGDRAAVRDVVFDGLRCLRSYAALGGGMTGRGIVLGSLRAAGVDVAALFTGEGHAPEIVTAADDGRTPEGAEALDCPDWLIEAMREALGEECAHVLQALRKRAPVFLRVNLARMTREKAQDKLAEEGIATKLNEIAHSALEITENARKLQNSNAYSTGLVELQDASSQAVVLAIDLRNGMRVLDLCAGGGGKTLALAAAADMQIYAHDADPKRLRDLPTRAARAGANIQLVEYPEKSGPYDLILTDVPCSGSGSWRRDPQGKWALTETRLAQLTPVQDAILDRAAKMLNAKGTLCYATCSLLRLENEERIAAFLARHSGWICASSQRFSLLQGGDGFYMAQLTRVV